MRGCTGPNDATHVANPSGIRLGAAPTIRVASKAIIVRDGHLLVTVNAGDFPTFLLVPGGGQEHGEDAHEALRRECREEIGCDVVVGEFAFLRDYIAADHEFAEQDGWATSSRRTSSVSSDLVLSLSSLAMETRGRPGSPGSPSSV